MTPEAAQFLAKAHKLLGDAAAMLEIDLSDAAGRTVYMAGFHAAQALISERAGRTVKTHKGVHTEFQRLTKDNQRLPSELRSFLSHAYNLKAIADYETGPGSDISHDQAARALELAARFVLFFDNLLTNPDKS